MSDWRTVVEADPNCKINLKKSYLCRKVDVLLLAIGIVLNAIRLRGRHSNPKAHAFLSNAMVHMLLLLHDSPTDGTGSRLR